MSIIFEIEKHRHNNITTQFCKGSSVKILTFIKNGQGHVLSQAMYVASWSSGRASDFGRGDRGSKPPVVERRNFGRKDLGSKPPPSFRSLGNFVYSTLPVSFGRDSKSHWLFYLVPMPGKVKDPHTGKWKTPAVDSLILEKDNSANKPLPC